MPPKESATIHQAPTFYVEHRGWSQEVNTTHYEMESDPAKRFHATGKRTPLDLDSAPKLVTHGRTPYEAVESFREALLQAPWHEHYSAVMRRIEALEAQVTAQQQPPASP